MDWQWIVFLSGVSILIALLIRKAFLSMRVWAFKKIVYGFLGGAKWVRK